MLFVLYTGTKSEDTPKKHENTLSLPGAFWSWIKSFKASFKVEGTISLDTANTLCSLEDGSPSISLIQLSFVLTLYSDSVI